MYSLILTLLDKNLALPSFRHHGNHKYMNLSMVSYDPVRQHIAASFNVLRANIATLCHDAAYRRLSIQSSLVSEAPWAIARLQCCLKAPSLCRSTTWQYFVSLEQKTVLKGETPQNILFIIIICTRGRKIQLIIEFFKHISNMSLAFCATAIVLELCSTQR